MEKDNDYRFEKQQSLSKWANRLSRGLVTMEENEFIKAKWRETTWASPEERLHIVLEIRQRDEGYKKRSSRKKITEKDIEAMMAWFNSRPKKNGPRPIEYADATEIPYPTLAYRVQQWRRAVAEAEEWLNEVD